MYGLNMVNRTCLQSDQSLLTIWGSFESGAIHSTPTDNSDQCADADFPTVSQQYREVKLTLPERSAVNLESPF